MATRVHRHLLEAGKRTIDQGDVHAALGLLHSFATIGEPVERAEAQLKLSVAHEMAGDLEAAMGALDEARVLGGVEALLHHSAGELQTIRLSGSLDPSTDSYAASKERIRSIINELET